MLKWILTGLLVFLILKYTLRGDKEKPTLKSSSHPGLGPRGTGSRPGGAGGKSANVDELVEDPQCGVYIPKETAVFNRRGIPFCSKECMDAHARKGA